MIDLRLLGVALLVFGQVGCRSTATNETSAVPDDGAYVPAEVDLENPTARDNPTPRELEPDNGYFGRREVTAEKTEASRRRGRDSDREAEVQEREPRRDGGALTRAKVHRELGDYDFAIEELESIGRGSADYAEAQRLLQQLR